MKNVAITTILASLVLCFGANYSGQLGNGQYFVQGTGTATQVSNFP